MGEKEAVYAVISDIWGLFKKYGFHELGQAEWERLTYEAMEVEKKYKKMGKRIHELYRGMYDQVNLYYRRVSSAKEEPDGQIGMDIKKMEGELHETKA